MVVPKLNTCVPKLLIPVDGELATVSPVNAQVNLVIKQLSPIVGFVVAIFAVHMPESTS